MKRIYWTGKAAIVIAIEGSKLAFGVLKYVWEVEGK